MKLFSSTATKGGIICSCNKKSMFSMAAKSRELTCLYFKQAISKWQEKKKTTTSLTRYSLTLSILLGEDRVTQLMGTMKFCNCDALATESNKGD